MMKKMTFTLDDDAVRGIERAADRLSIPKSQVVREAIRLYGQQLGRLTEQERADKLEAFDTVTARLEDRPRAEIAAELDALRDARAGGGRGGSGPR